MFQWGLKGLQAFQMGRRRMGAVKRDQLPATALSLEQLTILALTHLWTLSDYCKATGAPRSASTSFPTSSRHFLVDLLPPRSSPSPHFTSTRDRSSSTLSGTSTRHLAVAAYTRFSPPFAAFFSTYRLHCSSEGLDLP